MEVAKEFAGDVTFVGINVRDNDAAARAFEREHGVPYDSITSGDSAEAMGAFHSSLAAAAVPTTLVVDREGRVAARAIGPVTATTLRNLLEPVVAESQGTE
ncbi:TlpA family protein disulfide reductase [Nocardioides humi]|uniref:TlpA family protein disulfide reductase n=1 Tax=Nocardioides humi TaxID=449461 RepID=UPI0015E83F98